MIWQSSAPLPMLQNKLDLAASAKGQVMAIFVVTETGRKMSEIWRGDWWGTLFFVSLYMYIITTPHKLDGTEGQSFKQSLIVFASSRLVAKPRLKNPDCSPIYQSFPTI